LLTGPPSEIGVRNIRTPIAEGKRNFSREPAERRASGAEGTEGEEASLSVTSVGKTRSSEPSCESNAARVPYDLRLAGSVPQNQKRVTGPSATSGSSA
jgi:hypothetical protein